MRRVLSTVTLLILAGTLSAEEAAKPVRFNKDDVGKLPTGWKEARTGKGEGSVWRITSDTTAPSKTGIVITQTAKGPGPLYNICVAPGLSGKDVEISVAFKALTGDIDQGGGVVWRYQDANNYYIARMNPLEKNYRVYKVVDGRRFQLDSKGNIDLPKDKWHTLKVRHVGDKIECWLNDMKTLSGTDDAIKKAGGAGLWTKADAVTSFDNLTLTEAK